MRGFRLGFFLALPLLSTALSSYDIGSLFTLSIDESNTSGSPLLRVSSTANPDVVVIESLSSSALSEVEVLNDGEKASKGLRGSAIPPFLALGTSKVTKGPIKETQYVMKEREKWFSRTDSMSITAVNQPSPDSLVIEGTIYRSSNRDDTEATFTLTFSSAIANPFEAASGASLDFDLQVEDGHGNRVYLNLASPADEKVYGHGLQYTSINHKSKTVPIIISEQGIGRGLQPITGFLNTFVGGAGGDWHTTYGCKPIFVTDRNRGFMLKNTEASIFDYSLLSSQGVEIEVWGYPLSGAIYYYRDTPLSFTEMLTEYTGRMSSLPTWTQEGAIVGLEGGSDIVEEKMAALQGAGVKMVGLWLQDWAGLHHSYDGDRLQWNWKVSDEQYPDWNDLRSGMEASGIKMMTYINPYFQANLDDPDAIPSSQYTTGDAAGYFIKNSANETYPFKSGFIKFGCLDVTNPEAVEWMKDIIKENLIGEAGSYGWMSDFGEAVPFDAVMHSGISGAEHHNEYPELWQKLNRDAVRELGMDDDIAFFSRSAYSKSPGNARVFWLGDQLTTFDEKDGLITVVIAQQSGGLTGHSLAHSDIGGYTVVDYPLAHYHRSTELLKRWIELEAFSGSMFRTHVGSSFEDSDAQVWDDEDIMQHFGKFAKVFDYLKDYRASLFEKAELRGWPVARSMFMEFPGDAKVWDESLMASQLMFGSDFLVAPVVTDGDVTKGVYFPTYDGCTQWVSVWTGQTYDCGGPEVQVEAALGYIPVFYKSESLYGPGLKDFLATL